jgi:hypothetical protein
MKINSVKDFKKVVSLYIKDESNKTYGDLLKGNISSIFNKSEQALEYGNSIIDAINSNMSNKQLLYEMIKSIPVNHIDGLLSKNDIDHIKNSINYNIIQDDLARIHSEYKNSGSLKLFGEFTNSIFSDIVTEADVENYELLTMMVEHAGDFKKDVSDIIENISNSR